MLVDFIWTDLLLVPSSTITVPIDEGTTNLIHEYFYQLVNMLPLLSMLPLCIT